MSATQILWGQILVVLAIVLVTTWGATHWVAWKLGYQPQLGEPWFEIAAGVPIYFPATFSWWWYVYDAYAPQIFIEGAYIAASGGFISVGASWACRCGGHARPRLPRPLVPPAGPVRRKFRLPA